MIKVSRLADYAVVVLATLSHSRGKLVAASGVSEKTGLPEPTVAKVLKLMVKAGILSSIRGANGGYMLQKQETDITIAEIVMAVDGPISLAACVEGNTESCDYECHCVIKGRWDEVNLAIREALEGVTLADMLKEDPGRNMFLRDEEIHGHF